MDLKNLKARDRITIELKNPAKPKEILRKDNGDPMTITAYSMDSRAYRGIRDDLRKTYSGVEPGDLARGLLGEIVIELDMIYDGEPVTKEQFKELLEDPAFSWLLAQYDNAVHDRASFFDVPPSG